MTFYRYCNLITWKAIIFFSFFCLYPVIASAYDDKITHPNITVEAIRNSNLNDYLINSLGISEGIGKSLTYINESITVLELIKKGSTEEDSPMCRASNHFHNPLMLWDQSYLTDRPILLDIYCLNWIPPYSNITWATGYLSQPPGGSKASFLGPESPVNWDIARDNYYSALISSLSNRDYYFVETFEALGHVLHLLEDVSVPAHVRNDFTSHLTFNGIESWNPTKWYIQPYEYYVKNNPLLILNAQPVSPLFSNSKLTDFWDTDQYDGTNPSDSASLGLAEITNATYLSNSTILNNNPNTEHTFPYPNVDDVDYQICDGLSPDGSAYVRYISRQSKGPCPPVNESNNIDHFAAVSLLEKESNIVGLPISQLKLWLDDNVHNDYAEELIPRAVGYSAELLNYFFRGDIDLLEDTITGSGYVIINYLEEDMDGTFEIYYDNVNDERNLLWSASLTLDTLSSGNNTSSNISFTAPSDAKLSGSYIVVFKGRLGNESDAIIGKVIIQHNLAIFIRHGGVIKRCLTTYKDLMNDIPCTLEVANNIFGGPIIYNSDWFNNRIAQRAFKHNGRKIYLTQIGQEGTYLFDPITKQFHWLHDKNTFFNASDQNIYVLEFLGAKNVYIYTYTGTGLIQTGAYPSVPSTDYLYLEFVSKDGESYIRDSQMTEIGLCPSDNCTWYRKYYKYNIITGTMTEMGYHYYSEETKVSPGNNMYNDYYEYYVDIFQNSTPNGIEAAFEPTVYTYSEVKIGGSSGTYTGTIVIDHLINGDSFNTVVNYSSVASGTFTCQWTGDKVRNFGNQEIFSKITGSKGLLVPDRANAPYSMYTRYIADGAAFNQSCYSVSISETVSNLKTSYDVFESNTETLSYQTTFLAEDIIGRNFSLSGFVMRHGINNSPDYYDELVLYNHNGERIDQHVLNILGISDPSTIRGIFLVD